VLVGDRGMITEARITEDLKSAGLDWISALRAPAIKELLNSGALQLTLFDQRDMASITSPDFPGERLIVCRNPDLAAERSRKREDLLAATEKDLAGVKAVVDRKRNPPRGTAEIALKVGEVLSTHKMKKHFDLEITDAAFSFARKTDAIAAEAATDGLYVVRTSLTEDTLGDTDTVRSYKSLSYAARAGIEGTHTQAIRRCGLRKCRYIGLAKTRLQHVITAVAVNLVRVAEWHNDIPSADTRISRFAGLRLAA
jgi:hypothetical protein